MSEREDLIKLAKMADERGDKETAMQAFKRLESMDSAEVIQPKPPTLFDQFQRQIGRTGRIAAEAVGALPLMAADAGIAARNLATGSNYKSASQMYQEALDAAGFPRAKGGLEKGVDIAGQVVAGSRVIPNVGIKAPAPSGFIPKTKMAERLMQDEIVKQGDKFKVPVFYDDVGGSFARKVGTATNEIPIVGTSAGRAKQAEAITEAIAKKESSLGVGDDVPELLQKGLQGKLNSFRKTAGKLYDKASELLNTRGKVPSTEFDNAIAKEIAKQERLGTIANKKAVELLKKYQDAPRGDFSTMREIRSQLGSEISDFYKGGSPIGEKGVGALQSVKNALEKDMSKFADDVGGEARHLWKKADAFYQKGVTPFKQSGLRQLVKTDEPEKAWRYLVSQGGVKSRAAKMYRALDGEGRATVRYGLIKEAIEKASTKSGISPAKFAGYLEKHDDIVKTFFKGKELKEIEGFRNLMRHVERAGQFAENQPTGKRVIPFIIAGQTAASFLSPTAAAATAGLAGVTKSIQLMFQTKSGRDALIAASRYKPGSKQMEKVSKYLASIVATQRPKQ